MAALTTLMTRFCAGEDSWLARSTNTTSKPGISEARDSNGKPRCNKHNRRKHGENAENTVVNAGFRGSKPGQRKGPPKNKNPGPSSLDHILDRQCQIHGTLETPATHTNRECWVFKQAGKAGVKDGEGSQSNDIDEEPRHRTQEGKRTPPPPYSIGECGKYHPNCPLGPEMHP